MINLAIIKQNKLYSDNCLNLFSVEYLEFIEFVLERYKKDAVKELDKDKLSKLVYLRGLGTVIEVVNNFCGIVEIRDEYFELQKKIYR